MIDESDVGIVVMKEGGAVGALALGAILGRPQGDFETLIQPTGVPRDAEIARYCPALGVALVPPNEQTFARLRDADAVASITPNRRSSVGRTSFAPVTSTTHPLRALELRATPPNSSSLISIGLHNSYRRATGRGVRVAIVDTGVDTTHPDLAIGERVFEYRCFLSGHDPKDVHDRHGHGTMCAGLVGGRAETEADFRYSVAPDTSLLIAKAMGDDGQGYEADILEAICWAVMKKARIVSLSLGRRRSVRQAADPDYERLGARLRQLGVLLVAAAGDGSARPSRLAPVDDPASCDSYVAVGAVDAHNAIARFSPATMDDIGAIDLCAPGQGVLSASAKEGQGAYWSAASGTSAAAPIVSGVAALCLELKSDLTPDQLVELMRASARKTPEYNARDFGSGIVRVPA